RRRQRAHPRNRRPRLQPRGRHDPLQGHHRDPRPRRTRPAIRNAPERWLVASDRERHLPEKGRDFMSAVRALVGTRKGAFILIADGKRRSWDISGPHFAGWELYHLKGSPADPN